MIFYTMLILNLVYIFNIIVSSIFYIGNILTTICNFSNEMLFVGLVRPWTILILKHVQASETDQIISNVIGTLLLWRLISIRYYLSVADPGGHRQCMPPLRIQILSF